MIYAGLAGAKVLIVDDDDAVRRSMARMLEYVQVMVLEAPSGVLGVTRALADKPDVVLLDVDMPDIDGIDACRRLRAAEVDDRVPVLFLTGARGREVEALRAGGEDFLQKPVDPTVLLARLVGVVARRRVEPENVALLRLLQRHVPTPMRDGRVTCETIDAAILFSDLRGFTATSFDHAPEAMFAAISDILGHQAACIADAGGYVDHLTGDGLLAVFEGADEAARACRAAVAILSWAAGYTGVAFWQPPPIGLGIHWGTVHRGDLGGGARREYTVIGGAVNLAARLCGVAGPMEAIATREVIARASGQRIGEHRLVDLKGVADRTPVWPLKF